MEVYGLVGKPVGHSLSPPVHEAAYDAVGLDARYVLFEPSPDALGRALDGAQALGVAGLNVTVPYKESVLDMVEPDDRAAQIGAVNTVTFPGSGPPIGHNTDVTGVQRAFDHHDVQMAGADAVVVGAGGAGRACTWALVEAGASVSILNRTKARADRLAEASGAKAFGMDALADRLSDAAILVNATTVGMNEDRSVVPRDALHSELTVLDAVYKPLETRLLREAAAVGAETIDGGWMLLFQAASAFEIWTDLEAPLGPMNDALRARL
jgi:shikimate dehydrogenase